MYPLGIPALGRSILRKLERVRVGSLEKDGVPDCGHLRVRKHAVEAQRTSGPPMDLGVRSRCSTFQHPVYQQLGGRPL